DAVPQRCHVRHLEARTQRQHASLHRPVFDDLGRVGADAHDCSVEDAASTRSGEEADYFSLSCRALILLDRFLIRIWAPALLLFLGACSTYNPNKLDIDASIQAKSQNSRVQFLVLHYTATGNDASLKILSERNVSAHYLVTDEPRPHVYQLV